MAKNHKWSYDGKPDHKPHDHGKHKGHKAQANALRPGSALVQVECFDAATWGQINNQHTNRW